MGRENRTVNVRDMFYGVLVFDCLCYSSDQPKGALGSVVDGDEFVFGDVRHGGRFSSGIDDYGCVC